MLNGAAHHGRTGGAPRGAPGAPAQRAAAPAPQRLIHTRRLLLLSDPPPDLPNPGVASPVGARRDALSRGRREAPCHTPPGTGLTRPPCPGAGVRHGAGGSCGRSSSSTHVVTVMPPPSGGSTTSPLTVSGGRRPDRRLIRRPPPARRGPDRRHQQEQPRDRGEQTRHEEQQPGAQPQAGLAHVAGRDRAGPAQLPAAQRTQPLAAQQPEPATLDASTSSTCRPRTDQCATRIATAISTIGSSRSPRPILLPPTRRVRRAVDVIGRPPPDAVRDTAGSAACPARPAWRLDHRPALQAVPALHRLHRRRRGAGAAAPASSRAAPAPRGRARGAPHPGRHRETRAQRQLGGQHVAGEEARRVGQRAVRQHRDRCTPTVETCTTARPASTARSRDIASCWGSRAVAEGRVVGLDDEQVGTRRGPCRGRCRRRPPRSR